MRSFTAEHEASETDEEDIPGRLKTQLDQSMDEKVQCQSFQKPFVFGISPHMTVAPTRHLGNEAKWKTQIPCIYDISQKITRYTDGLSQVAP
jgi:hypothetical protein